MKLHLSFFTFQFLLTTTISAQQISLNSTISASETNSRWSSPNNTFAFTFIPNPSAADRTLIPAITYNTIPIWSINVSTTSSSVLRLQSSGDLQLLPTSTSSSPVWSSGTANRGVSAASLDDSGNFVLSNSSGAVVWSTFDNPTDTIVPSQNFTVDQTLSSGIYSFRVNSNGNLTLTWNNSIEYYNSGLNSTGNSTFRNPTIAIQQIGILALFDSSLSGSLILAYSSDYADQGDIFRFLKLDSDGNLRIYSSVRDSGVMNVRWAAVSDQCQVYGYCGNMGICSYNDSGPVCGCASLNFDLIDPSNSRGGCRRRVDLRDCPGSETMLELDHARFLTFGAEASQVFYSGIQPCRLNCLSDSSCSASTSFSDGTGLCSFKTNNIYVSGSQSPSIPSTSWMKVCGPILPNPSVASTSNGRTTRWRLTAWLVVVVIVCTILLLIAVEGGLWWWCFRNSTKFGGLSAQYALLEYASGAPVQFSYKELHRATKGFKEKLGAGGFGAVYRGILANKTIAAVKQLEGIEQGEKQFRMEVATISSTHHLNLVRLLGFCSEGKHRLLVYEFMKNTSLDNFLFRTEEDTRKHLNWESRFNIALGTARGITYLHEECRDCIIHCDIKPENILLDENYNAKVSDFGLAKLVNPKDHRYRTLTSVRGTRGYLAPEWLANLPITSKSDVYSFGMVLLEIVSGRRNFEVSSETNQKKFSIWAYEEFDKGNYEGIIDRRLVNNSSNTINMDQVKRAIEVSFWCIQEQPSQRPMMGKVVQMLDGVIEIVRPPVPKAVVIEGSVGNGSSISAISTFGTSIPVRSSTSSSMQNAGGVSFSVSTDRATSSLLHSEVEIK